jgi:hypothetical protein
MIIRVVQPDIPDDIDLKHSPTNLFVNSTTSYLSIFEAGDTTVKSSWLTLAEAPASISKSTPSVVYRSSLGRSWKFQIASRQCGHANGSAKFLVFPPF